MLAQAEGHVVKHIQVRKQCVALEHIAKTALVNRYMAEILPVEQEAAAENINKAGHGAQCGGFAATAGSQQGNQFPLRNVNTKVLQDNVFAVAGADVFQFNQCHGNLLSSFAA